MADLVVIGLSHRTAPVELREQIAIPEEALEATVRELGALEGVAEALLVSTCNRVEAYVVARGDGAACAATVEGFFRARAAAAGPHLYRKLGPDATRHLFRVASSLDSMVVGEPQILGQVKDARELGQRVGTVGALLDKLLSRAFGVAKRVRTETAIARNSASVASVAADLAGQVFGELKGRLVLVVGAGKMSALAARHLGSAGAEDVLVVNRSPERAERLAAEIGGAARPWRDLEQLLGTVDIVISSTGAPHPVITRDMVRRVMKARRSRSLFLIDIAVPRDVEPEVGKLDDVYLFDVDDLEKVVAQNLGARQGDVSRAEAIVDEELRRFGEWQRSLGVVPTITALRERFLGVARAEVERVLPGLGGLSEKDARTLRQLADAIANKLLHQPLTQLKKEAGAAGPEADAAVELVRKLFALSDDTTAQPAAETPGAGQPDDKATRSKQGAGGGK